MSYTEYASTQLVDSVGPLTITSPPVNQRGSNSQLDQLNTGPVT